MPKVHVFKYTETPTFHFFNANPKGKNASDCVVRALCVALEQDYQTTARELLECGLEIGYACNEDKTINEYLARKGWIRYKKPTMPNNKAMRVSGLVLRERKGTVVVKVGAHHISLIKDGVIWDTWDCSKKVAQQYWRKD